MGKRWRMEHKRWLDNRSFPPGRLARPGNWIDVGKHFAGVRHRAARVRSRSARMPNRSACLRNRFARIRNRAARVKNRGARKTDRAARMRNRSVRMRNLSARIRNPSARIRNRSARIRNRAARVSVGGRHSYRWGDGRFCRTRAFACAARRVIGERGYGAGRAFDGS